MAKQFAASVNGVEYLFPSGGVMLVASGDVSTIQFQGKAYPTASPIEDVVALANTGGTEQVQLTVLRVNDSVQTNAIQMSFPVNGFTVNDSTLSGSSAVVNFEGTRYYVVETQEEIETAANTGGGSSGTPTLDEVLAEGATLTENRTVILAGNTFNINQGSNDFFSVNGEDGNQGFRVQAIDPTGDSNGAKIQGFVDETEATVYLEAAYQDGTKDAKINLYANTTSGEIEYTADLHEFTGRSVGTTRVEDNYADDAAAAAGGIEVGGNYHTSGACKIRLA
jgi:hypothetical protein